MPALNEEESIGKTISMIPLQEIQNLGYNTEILIVDGGSSDNTQSIASSLGAKVIASHKGYGRQYLAGFAASAGEIIVTADSDCSYPMEEITVLLGMLEKEKLDFIHTNRFARMDHDSMLPLNKFGNKVLTLTTNILFGFGFRDSQSGMWVFRREILEKLRLEGKGMSLSQEIKIKAFARCRAREVDSSYRKRVGTVKLRKLVDGADNLWSLIKLRFSL